MALTIASAHLEDGQFLEKVESCELPLCSFRHGDHLRLAWLYLHDKPFEEALISVRNAISGLAAHHGVSHIFHETRTIAWVMLLRTHNEMTFAHFIAQNESRLNQGLLHRFWSPECIESDDARSRWIPPDRAQLTC
jgi:hypothetical protein